MANSFPASRAMLVYALCLPLAVLMGYLLTDPMQSSSILVVMLVLGGLSIPLLMHWYHPLLILTWNAAIVPYFLPGQPYLWIPLALMGFAFAVVNRFTSAEAKFVKVPSLLKPMLFLLGVVIFTAWSRGGLGLRSFGSSIYGGRRYLYILAAILGYFALTSQRIPRQRARLMAGLFFLAGITSLVPNLAYLGGRSLEWLYFVFPPYYALEQAIGDWSLTAGITRIYGFTFASIALFCWLMVQYGIRGLFEWTKPWRLGLLAMAMTGALFCGFRSVLILIALLSIIQFWLEGLCRGRNLLIALGVVLVGISVMLPNADKMPLVVQRTLSFLPVEVSPVAKAAAQNSSDWRFRMWQETVALVPRYLIQGKGYAFDPTDLEFAQMNYRRGFGTDFDESIITGDYHSGPLTLIIPLGIWGAIGFIWLIIAGFKFLYHNYRFGDPALRRVNTFLLAFFAARTLVFFFVFGAFSSELFFFTGVLGLSVSLNGAPALEEEAEGAVAEETEAEGELVPIGERD